MSDIRKEQINYNDDIVITGSLQTDNIKQDGNTISSTNTNGNIAIEPDGTGVVTSSSAFYMGNVAIGGNNITTLNTGGGLTLSTLSDGDIAISPQGTGKVFIGKNVNMGGNSFEDTYVTGGIPLGESGETALSGFTNTSIVGALNELKSGGTACYFEARRSTTASNVTGDGSTYYMVFDTEIIDVGNDYNNSTGIFTCPVNGIYNISWAFRIEGITASHINGVLNMGISSSILTTRFIEAMNLANNRTNANTYSMGGSLTFYATASATVQPQLTVSGGTKVISVEGFNVITIPCYICGLLLRQTS